MVKVKESGGGGAGGHLSNQNWLEEEITRTSRELPLCQESASEDPDVKSRGPARWVGGKESRAADKNFLLGTGALKPVPGVTAEIPRRSQSLFHSIHIYCYRLSAAP